MKKQRFYVHPSSMFDSIPYDIGAMRARLRVNGLISHPRACCAYGWNNQPQVLTFRIARNVTLPQVADCLSTLPEFGGRKPIIRAQDW